MYSVFVKIGNGEFVFVASREDFQDAEQLVQDLNAAWPNEYIIRDSNGNDVDTR